MTDLSTSKQKGAINISVNCGVCGKPLIYATFLSNGEVKCSRCGATNVIRCGGGGISNEK